MADAIETLVAEIAAEVQRISGLTADQLGYTYGGLSRELATSPPSFAWHEADDFALEMAAIRPSGHTHDWRVTFQVVIWHDTQQAVRGLIANLNIAARVVCYPANFRITGGTWTTEVGPELAKRGAQAVVTVELLVPLPAAPQEVIGTADPVPYTEEVTLIAVDGSSDIQ